MTNGRKTLGEMKAVLAGPEGKPIAGYPLGFVTQAIFGPPPQHGAPMVVNSASAALLQLAGQMLVVTCHHVLEEYRMRRNELAACQFQFGNCLLDPEAQLVDESKVLDVAVVHLTEAQVRELRASPVEGFGRNFIEPPVWPPGNVAEGDFVAFGGFPGSLRKAPSFLELNFGSYSSGATRVTTSRDDYLVCQFDRENWVRCGHGPEPETIRGLSGGPVFALRRTDANIVWYEFVGIVYEFSEDYELLYVRLGRTLAVDGTILT